MAYIQNTKIPPNKKEELTVEDFSGGLNNRSNLLEDNESPYILNMKFSLDDVLEKRNGFKHFDNFIIDEPITHLDLYQPYRDEDELIRSSDTKMYSGEVKIADVNGSVVGVNYNGKYVFCDGTGLYVYGKHSQDPSEYVKIIGSPNPNAVVLQVVNPPEEFEPLGTEHYQGVTVYNYDEGTVHYEPCEHEILDPYKGANVLPENPSFLVVHGGRLFVSGDINDDDNVFISDINNGNYFAVSLPIQLPPNSDKVTGMIVYDDTVVVGRRYDLYYISGKTNNPDLGFDMFSLRKLNSHTGFANHKAITIVHNYLFFLGSDGIAYAMSAVRNNERVLTTQIISSKIDIFKYPISATSEDVLDASSCFDDEYWYLTIGDKTLVYSYRLRAWTMYDEIDMYTPLYYYDKLIWGRRDGSVADFSDYYLDLRKPMYAVWRSKVFDMGSPIRYKQFRELYLVAHTFDDNNSDIRVDFEIDYTDVTNEIVIENQIAKWGKAKFGDRFINRNINTSIPFVVGRRAKNFRVSISNGYRIEAEVDTKVDLDDIRKKYKYMGAYVENEDRYYYYKDGSWYPLDDKTANQPVRVYQINVDYEMKGKR
jgi:hypothetical protein